MNQLFKTFVPLKFELGEAFHFDWSEEGLVVGGTVPYTGARLGQFFALFTSAFIRPQIICREHLIATNDVTR